MGAKNQLLIDSLKHSEYPYVLPILGEQATKRGFQLPYSAGVGLNYFYQKSELVLNNLEVGFNGGQKYNLDNIVRFNGAQSQANAVNFRPDIWLFPFLNVYGVFGQAKTSTTIDAGVYIPDTNNNWNSIASINTKADFNATALGFGIVPTFGVGGGWIAVDMNFVWTDVSALEKPVFTFVVGPRIGKTIKFKDPEKNIAFWAGGFRVNFTSSTKGTIYLDEVVSVDELAIKVDNAIVKVNQAQEDLNNWWGGLSAVEKLKPENIAKNTLGNKVIESASNFLNAADVALSDDKKTTIQYSLEKNLKDKWNFLLGSQYQINRHWMVRAEYGFLGSRTQGLLGLQYRFGL